MEIPKKVIATYPQKGRAVAQWVQSVPTTPSVGREGREFKSLIAHKKEFRHSLKLFFMAPYRFYILYSALKEEDDHISRLVNEFTLKKKGLYFIKLIIIIFMGREYLLTN